MTSTTITNPFHEGHTMKKIITTTATITAALALAAAPAIAEGPSDGGGEQPQQEQGRFWIDTSTGGHAADFTSTGTWAPGETFTVSVRDDREIAPGESVTVWAAASETIDPANGLWPQRIVALESATLDHETRTVTLTMPWVECGQMDIYVGGDLHVGQEMGSSPTTLDAHFVETRPDGSACVVPPNVGDPGTEEPSEPEQPVDETPDEPTEEPTEPVEEPEAPAEEPVQPAEETPVEPEEPAVEQPETPAGETPEQPETPTDETTTTGEPTIKPETPVEDGPTTEPKAPAVEPAAPVQPEAPAVEPVTLQPAQAKPTEATVAPTAEPTTDAVTGVERDALAHTGIPAGGIAAIAAGLLGTGWALIRRH